MYIQFIVKDVDGTVQLPTNDTALPIPLKYGDDLYILQICTNNAILF